MAAKSLIEQQKVNYLFIKWRQPNFANITNQEQCFRDLRKMGVPETLMFRDFAGFRTLDSVVRADKIFKVQAFTIVSQKFHCERALLIAKAHNIDAICFVAKQPELHLSTRIREVFARIKAVLDLILGVEPYFLGEPQPLPNSTTFINIDLNHIYSIFVKSH
ncbi:SanA [Haemophilus influenzae]|uniref:SanA n=1 Tax=Haemophilus influenzae TaxID=727 RepID=A0A2X1PZZ4_HAEIF|nr:SanA [Haemophilus influenzae]